MRHLKRTAKLGRTSEHRNAMLANLVCSLIEHKRVTTTLAKAKAARSVAEKMVTLGKSGTIHDRRLAVARLHQEAAAKHPVQGHRARVQGSQGRLHPHHQDEPAQRRRRPARDSGMGGFCGRSSGGPGSRARQPKPSRKRKSNFRFKHKARSNRAGFFVLPAKSSTSSTRTRKSRPRTK